MARSPVYWLWLASCALAVAGACSSACSSSDAKKAPRSYEAAGEGGGDETARGGASDGAGTGGSSEAGDPAGRQAGAGGEAGAGAATMTDGWLSGSRLRAVVYAVGDAKRFHTWHDLMLDADCQFAVDSDGTERCLPTFDTGYAMYSDSKCMTPVLVLDAGVTAPDIAAEPYQPFECGKGLQYLKVGADAPGVTDLFSNSSGDCQPNGTLGVTQTAKKLGAAVSNTLFVGASQTLQEPRDERLNANVRFADDGSRQVISHYDLTREAECNPRLHEGDGYACTPEDRAYIEYFFADDKCMTPAAYHPAYAQQVCGRAPKIVQESRPFFTDLYYEVGAKVNEVYRKDATCDLYVSPGDPGASYYLAGKVAPFTSFPPLSSAHEGKGRIVLQVLRGAANELVSREDFFDTTLDVTCGPGLAEDLELRCVPRGPYSVNLFADAKCSHALFTNPQGAALPDNLEYLNANALSGGTATFKIGAKVATPAQAYQMNGTTCELAATSDAEDYYDTTAITAAQLAKITLEQE
ncbi:MAG TPA: hypothetical protein VHB79_19820 [Polyangiaceae bacterium]|nr:hypothetical protein [Polyangiaceae bacterium]